MFTRTHFLVVKLKRNFFAFLFLAFLFSLLIFSKNNLPAVKSGLILWATSVVPSLFPFFVATDLLMHTNVVSFLGRILGKWMKPIFHIRGEGAFCFLMGIISGYPVGAKIASRFRQEEICSKEECERLLSFTNNSGPLFIVGTVGISMFGNTSIGVLLLITHILACITVGFIFRFWKNNPNNSKDISDDSRLTNYSQKNTAYQKNGLNSNSVVTFSNLGEVLAESITSSTSTILLIGGFVVLFSSIISILKASGLLVNLSYLLSPVFEFLHIDTSIITPLLTGFLEITNGLNLLTSLHLKQISLLIILSAFLLGFGGISVLLQVWSITSKTDLSIKPYLYGKLLHGIIAAFYTFLALQIPFFNLDL